MAIPSSVSVEADASVASSGSVGYVGLVVPHLVRLSTGSDNRTVIPAATLAGAIFVIVADTVARTVIAVQRTRTAPKSAYLIVLLILNFFGRQFSDLGAAEC